MTQKKGNLVGFSTSKYDACVRAIGLRGIEFLKSDRCSIYPFCYLIPKECYLAQSSGLDCEHCSYRVYSSSEEDTARIQELFQHLVMIKEKRHLEFLKSRKWKKVVRPRILEHDDHTCVVCRKKSFKGMHVHHIMFNSADEDLSPSNLVVLCSDCHAMLHPIFPKGMWLLGWPEIDTEKLREFYSKVSETSKKYRERFKAPLEHVMGHICLICPQIDQCIIGNDTRQFIQSNMEGFQQMISERNRVRISQIKDGMKWITVEGRITEIHQKKEVETKYGETFLAITTLEDDSGKITLNLWGKQIELVKLGDVVRIEKAYTKTYEEILTLNVLKKGGKIEVIN